MERYWMPIPSPCWLWEPSSIIFGYLGPPGYGCRGRSCSNPLSSTSTVVVFTSYLSQQNALRTSTFVLGAHVPECGVYWNAVCVTKMNLLVAQTVGCLYDFATYRNADTGAPLKSGGPDGGLKCVPCNMDYGVCKFYKQQTPPKKKELHACSEPRAWVYTTACHVQEYSVQST